MTDLRCVDCGATSTYADAQISDRLNTCTRDEDKGVENLRVVRETALGRKRNGKSHTWKEI